MSLPPPIGSAPGNTHVKFLDEVSQLVQYFITNYKNPVLLGDFNIHVQDLANLDSLVFNDTVEAIGLIQHIIEPTHQLGNTLDLIYTESLEAVKVLHVFLGDYISDHRLAGIEVHLRKQQEKSESTSHRNYRGLNLDDFRKAFNNNRILEKENLEEAFTEFKEEMTRALDELAPLEDRGKPKGKSRPWYNSQLSEQRKVTRNRERTFNKYREDHHWRAFTREWNRYNRMLEFNKTHYIITKVSESTNNSSQLFKLVGNLLEKRMKIQCHHQPVIVN